MTKSKIAQVADTPRSRSDHFWDLTSLDSLVKVVLKFRREGAEVENVGLNDASATIKDRIALHDQPGALNRMLEH